MTAPASPPPADDEPATIHFPAAPESPPAPLPAPVVIEDTVVDQPVESIEGVHDLLLREHGRAAVLAQTTRNGYRLGQLRASWLSTLNSPGSVEVYNRDLNQFLDYCLEYDLEPLTLGIPQFNLFVTWLKLQTTRYGKPYSNATLVRKVDEIASFYNHLVDVDAIDRSPVTKKARPKRQLHTVDKALTLSETRIVIADAAAGHRTLGALCAELIAELIFTMGIRVSEVCALDLDQLFWVEKDGIRHRGIRFIGKGGQEHVRGIPAELDERLLTPYLAQRPTPVNLEHAAALFLTLKGERVDRFQIYRIVGRSTSRGKIDRKVTPHSGRHTFNLAAEEADVPLEARQRALGHASAATTQRYGASRNSVVSDPSRLVARRLHDSDTRHDPTADTIT